MVEQFLVLCTDNSFGICQIDCNWFILYPLFIYFNFLWNLKNLYLFILGCFYTENAQEKHRSFWACENSLLAYCFLHLLLVSNWILFYCIFSFHFANTYLMFLWLYLERQVRSWMEACLFFRHFVGIGLLIFSGTQRVVRGLFSVVCNRAGFSRQKESQKNRDFWIYWNI